MAQRQSAAVWQGDDDAIQELEEMKAYAFTEVVPTPHANVYARLGASSGPNSQSLH
jgi:hypothetical protein